MTKERMLELREKYSRLFEFAEKYSDLLSYLKAMVVKASDENSVISYSDNAIGFFDCLVDLGKISHSESFFLVSDLFDFRRDIIGL